MPPRRTSSRITSTSKNGANGHATPTGTPKRKMRKISQNRDKSATPPIADDSSGELDAEVRARQAEQTGPGQEAVLDEIIVSRTPKDANKKVINSRSESPIGNKNGEETSTVLRRSSRTSSISQKPSPAASSLNGNAATKKQELGIDNSGNDDGDLGASPHPPPTSRKRRADPVPGPRVTFRKSRSKWDNPDEMLTNPNSPLVKAKLRELLCSPMAWDVLSPEEREQVLSKFPDDTMILDSGTVDARPDIGALLNSNNFRNDVTRYQEGLGKGYHDPEWIQQAQAAHRSREAGLYDDYMAADFQEKWDMPMPQKLQSGSGTSGSKNHQADTTSEEEANSQPNESKADEQTNHQGACDMYKVPSPEISHAMSIEDSATNQNSNTDDANDSSVMPTHNPSPAKEVQDQPPEYSCKQETSIPAEAATMSDFKDLGSQQPKGPNLDAKILGALSSDLMEDEHQGAEERVEIAETQQPRTNICGGLHC
ncbi:Asx homology domain-containing protein [Xylaria arbuscula]|nr:Asx homology domain-containing protein [Xylaria arbuscula]